MKICLNIYKANDALNYSTSKNKKYPTILYYSEDKNIFNFYKLSPVLEKTTNLFKTNVNIEKFAAYITTIDEINHLLKYFDDKYMNDTWKTIFESLKEKVSSNESLYFKIQLKDSKN